MHKCILFEIMKADKRLGKQKHKRLKSEFVIVISDTDEIFCCKKIIPLETLLDASHTGSWVVP